jgi:antitoxin VapB
MALQIANPVVVAKVERLAKLTGMSKTTAVEAAVDLLLRETTVAGAVPAVHFAAVLAQMDKIPDRTDASDPLMWNEHGLPQ